MIPTHTGLMMHRMPLHIRGPRNCSRFTWWKWQHPDDLEQSETLRPQEVFVCSPRVQKAQRTTFLFIKLHKPTIYQKVNTVCSNILKRFLYHGWHYMSWLKKYILFKCLLLTWSFIPRFDNNWDEPRQQQRQTAASGNQWQSSIQASSHRVSAERGNGKHRGEPQYKPSETTLMKKHLLRIDLQMPGITYCWSSIKINIWEELSASKQVWEKSRANLQHMGITKTRCSQFGCINMEYVCVNIHLWS